MAYVAPLILRLDGLTAKLETTTNTDANPPTTAGIRVTERVWNSLRAQFAFPNLRDDAANAGLVPLGPAAARGWYADLTIGWEFHGVTGPYSAGVALEADPLIQACGWIGTFSAAPTPQWTYVPVSTQARPSCTIYAYAGGQLWKLVGCRGRWRPTFRAGQISVWRFEMRGIISAAPTDAALPAITYTAIVPPPAVGLGITVGSWAVDPQEISIDGGNTVEMITTGNQTDAIQSFDYGLLAPEIRIVGNAVPLATAAPLSDQQAATQRALALTLGSAQYNRVAISDTGLAIIAEQKVPVASRFAGYDLRYRMPNPSVLVN